MRRATFFSQVDCILFDISIHALREESDRYPFAALVPADTISIHALREESDGLHPTQKPVRLFISIHALREESDSFR